VFFQEKETAIYFIKATNYQSTYNNAIEPTENNLASFGKGWLPLPAQARR
jgi:hypothetical protein